MTNQIGGKSYTMVMRAEVIPGSLQAEERLYHIMDGAGEPTKTMLGYPVSRVMAYTDPLGFRSVVRQWKNDPTILIGLHLISPIENSYIHVHLPTEPCDDCMEFADIRAYETYWAAVAASKGGWAMAKFGSQTWHWVARGSDVPLCPFEPPAWDTREVQDPKGGRKCSMCLKHLKRREENGE